MSSNYILMQLHCHVNTNYIIAKHATVCWEIKGKHRGYQDQEYPGKYVVLIRYTQNYTWNICML